MTQTSKRLPALLLAILSPGCQEEETPAEARDALPVVPAEWMEREDGRAQLEPPTSARTPEPEASSLRALLVGDQVVACALGSETFAGAACPSGSATGLEVMAPGAQHLPRRSVTIGPGVCGHAGVRTRGADLEKAEARHLEELSTDSTKYRDLIGPEVGVPRPAEAPGFRLDQLLRIDLDGDGTQEVLFSAQGQLGVRRIVEEKAETVLIPTVSSAGVPVILGVADLEGDGPLEVVAWSGESLPGLGTQWIGHWVITGLQPGETPRLAAQAGCDQESPPRPAPGD